MEPKLPAPNLEHVPSPVSAPEIGPEVAAGQRPEILSEQQAERMEQRGETSASALASGPILPMPVLPQPPVPIITDDAQQVADDGTPQVAGDDDLIEKEWVDRAKQIITQTRDDPHRREQEVSKLQVDYLRKRYGKELGASQ